MYTQTYDALHLTVLDAKQCEQHSGYWYIVTDHCTSHTAFRTETGLLRWLSERGLQLTQPLTQPGEWSTQKVIGTYHVALHPDEQAFYNLDNVVMLARALDNGALTLAIITEQDGERTVHKLNPNVKTRPVFRYIYD